MDPLLLKKLSDKNGPSNYIGYDEKADIWALGTKYDRFNKKS